MTNLFRRHTKTVELDTFTVSEGEPRPEGPMDSPSTSRTGRSKKREKKPRRNHSKDSSRGRSVSSARSVSPLSLSDGSKPNSRPSSPAAIQTPNPVIALQETAPPAALLEDEGFVALAGRVLGGRRLGAGCHLIANTAHIFSLLLVSIVPVAYPFGVLYWTLFLFYVPVMFPTHPGTYLSIVYWILVGLTGLYSALVQTTLQVAYLIRGKELSITVWEALGFKLVTESWASAATVLAPLALVVSCVLGMLNTLYFRIHHKMVGNKCMPLYKTGGFRRIIVSVSLYLGTASILMAGALNPSLFGAFYIFSFASRIVAWCFGYRQLWVGRRLWSLTVGVSGVNVYALYLHQIVSGGLFPARMAKILGLFVMPPDIKNVEWGLCVHGVSVILIFICGSYLTWHMSSGKSFRNAYHLETLVARVHSDHRKSMALNRRKETIAERKDFNAGEGTSENQVEGEGKTAGENAEIRENDSAQKHTRVSRKASQVTNAVDESKKHGFPAIEAFKPLLTLVSFKRMAYAIEYLLHKLALASYVCWAVEYPSVLSFPFIVAAAVTSFLSPRKTTYMVPYVVIYGIAAIFVEYIYNIRFGWVPDDEDSVMILDALGLHDWSAPQWVFLIKFGLLLPSVVLYRIHALVSPFLSSHDLQADILDIVVPSDSVTAGTLRKVPTYIHHVLIYSYYISLSVTYICGLSRVDIMHAGYLLIALVFLLAPRIAEKSWLFIIVYTLFVITVLYVYQILLRGGVESGPWAPLIGLENMGTHGSIWEGMFIHLIIISFLMIEWHLYRLKNKRQKALGRATGEVVADDAEAVGLLNRIVGFVRLATLPFVYICLIFVFLFDTPSFFNLVLFVLLCACISCHPIGKRTYKLLKVLWSVLCYYMGMVLAMIYIYQFENMDHYLLALFKTVDLDKYISANDIGLQKLENAALYYKLITNTALFVMGMFQQKLFITDHHTSVFASPRAKLLQPVVGKIGFLVAQFATSIALFLKWYISISCIGFIYVLFSIVVALFGGGRFITFCLLTFVEFVMALQYILTFDKLRNLVQAGSEAKESDIFWWRLVGLGGMGDHPYAHFASFNAGILVCATLTHVFNGWSVAGTRRAQQAEDELVRKQENAVRARSQDRWSSVMNAFSSARQSLSFRRSFSANIDSTQAVAAAAASSSNPRLSMPLLGNAEHPTIPESPSMEAPEDVAEGAHRPMELDDVAAGTGSAAKTDNELGSSGGIGSAFAESYHRVKSNLVSERSHSWGSVSNISGDTAALAASQQEYHDLIEWKVRLDGIYGAFMGIQSMVGFEMCLIGIVFTMFMRDSWVGLLCWALLGLLMWSPKKLVMILWPACVLLFSILMLVQYLLLLSLTDDHISKAMEKLRLTKSQLLYVGIYVQKSSLVADYIAFFLMAHMFRILMHNKTKFHPQGRSETDFTRVPRSRFSWIKFVFFMHFNKVCLLLVFIFGTLRYNLLSFGYLAFSLWYLRMGDNMYFKGTKVWRVLQIYNYLLFLVLLLYQIVYVFYPDFKANTWTKTLGLRELGSTALTFDGVLRDVIIFSAIYIQARLFESHDHEYICEYLRRQQYYAIEQASEFYKLEEMRLRDAMKELRDQRKAVEERIHDLRDGIDWRYAQMKEAAEKEAAEKDAIADAVEKERSGSGEAAKTARKFVHKRSPPVLGIILPDEDERQPPFLQSRDKSPSDTSGRPLNAEESDGNDESEGMKKHVAVAMLKNFKHSFRLAGDKAKKMLDGMSNVYEQYEGLVEESEGRRRGQTVAQETEDAAGPLPPRALVTPSMRVRLPININIPETPMETPRVSRFIEDLVSPMNDAAPEPLRPEPPEESDPSWTDRYKDLVIRMMQATSTFVMLHSDTLVYISFICNFMIYQSVISLLYPCSLFFYATLQSPRPAVTYWKVMIFYTEIVMLLVYLYQLFPFLDSENSKDISSGDPKDDDDSEVFDRSLSSILGLTVLESYWIGTLMHLFCLVCLVARRNSLQMLGLWYVEPKKRKGEDFDIMSGDESVPMDDPPEELSPDITEMGGAVEDPTVSPALDAKTKNAGSGSDSRDGGSPSENVDLDLNSPRDSRYSSGVDHRLSRTFSQGSDDGESALDVCRALVRSVAQPFTSYFGNILDLGDKPGYDLYVVMLLPDLVAFVIIILSQLSLLMSAVSNPVIMFPKEWILLLLGMFMIIVVDRGIYIQKSVFAKLCLHYTLVVSYHILMFFPQSLGFNSYWYVRAFYFFKALYLWSSGSQIRRGYPLATTGEYLTRSFHFINMWIYMVYLLIPFWYETRHILDWACQDTALELKWWLKFKDIQQRLFYVKCIQQDRLNNPRKLGTKQPWWLKLFAGIGLFLLLIGVLWAPLFLFSSANPTASANKIDTSSIQVNIEGTKGSYRLYSVTRTKDIYNLNRADYTKYSVPLVYQSDDLWVWQRIHWLQDSEKLWDISPPSFDQLKKSLNSTDDTYVTVTMSFTRESGDLHTVEKSKSDLLSSENKAKLLHAIDHGGSATIPQFIPRYLYVTAKGTPTVKDPLSGPAYCDVVLSAHNVAEENSTKITKPYENWWSVEMIPHGADPISDDSGPWTLVLSDPTQTGPLAGLAQIGLVSIYITFVYAIGKILRMYADGIAQRTIIYEDLPCADFPWQLCSDIDCARQAGDLALEEELYWELIHLYRSPETLIARTKIKDD